jgi:hypothetical protein
MYFQKIYMYVGIGKDTFRYKYPLYINECNNSFSQFFYFKHSFDLSKFDVL